MFSLRSLLRHPLQFALMMLGIALGVAVMVGIDLSNAAAERAFDLSASAVTGRATHVIVGGSAGVEETFYVRLRTDPDLRHKVESAPVIRTVVVSPQLGAIPFTLLGIDPFAEAPFRSYLGREGQFNFRTLAPLLTRPGAILLSAPTAARYGLLPCPGEITAACQLTLTVEGQTHIVYLVGVLEPADDFARRALETLVLTDLATAQTLTGLRGKLTQIDLILPESGDLPALQAALPPGVLLTTSATRNEQVNLLTAAFRLNLLALSLLALVVGMFLIYNTMTFSVVQRRPLFGILRSLGYTREQVFGMVMGEAALVGALGAGLGLGLGILLGQVAVQMVTQTINDLFFVINVRETTLPPGSLLKGALAGLFASLLASAPPAWEAAATPPRLALSREGLERKAGSAVHWAALLGVLTALLGAGILSVPTRSLVVSFAGTFAVVLGLAAITPFVTVMLMRLFTPFMGWFFGLLGQMAPRNVIRAQSRTAVAVAALMVAVAVTIGVQVMIASFRVTVTLWLEQTLQGDIYIAAEGLSAARLDTPLDARAIEQAQNHPQVASAAYVRVVSVETDFGPVDLVAATPDPWQDTRILLQGNPQTFVQELKDGAILLSEPLAARLGISSLAEPFRILTPRGWVSFRLAGIYADYASTRGTIRMALETYQSLWGDSRLNGVALTLQPGADVDTVTADLRGRLSQFPRVQVNPSGALRAEALALFDRTFAITAAMQLVTTLVAFIGVLSSLLALQLEKARETGILRALGLTVGEMRRLTLLETSLLGASAGLLALPTGYILAWILIYIINQRSFGWTLQMQADPLPFLQAFLLAIVASLLAGVYPALRMSQIQPAEALRAE
ncbi:MAG: ABC transporter permease [Anaerolineales bacterium]|nr:ABC transporter permease [Anaerolineales bacterium]MDW8277728.1 FtsX-like permease family protein [Anaerolineales bacterium]